MQYYYYIRLCKQTKTELYCINKIQVGYAVYCQWKRQLVKPAVQEMKASQSQSHQVTWPTPSLPTQTKVRRSVLGFFKVSRVSGSLCR